MRCASLVHLPGLGSEVVRHQHKIRARCCTGHDTIVICTEPNDDDDDDDDEAKANLVGFRIAALLDWNRRTERRYLYHKRHRGQARHSTVAHKQRIMTFFHI